MRLMCALALVSATGSTAAETRSVTANIWVDNWFEMYVNGTTVTEDGVPISDLVSDLKDGSSIEQHRSIANVISDLRIFCHWLKWEFQP